MNRSIYNRRKSVEAHLRPAQWRQPIPGYFIQSLPVPMCIVDRQTGVYLEVNPAFARLLGLQRRQIVNQKGSDLPAGPGDSSLKNIFKQLETETTVRALDLIVFQTSGRVIRSGAQAQSIDFAGREAVLISFKTLPDVAEKSAAEVEDAKFTITSRLSTALTQCETAEEVFRHLTAAVNELLPDCSAILIARIDASRHTIPQIFSQHAGEPLKAASFPEMPFDPDGSGLINEAVRTAQPVISDQRDERQKTTVTRMGLYTPGKIIQSGISVPLNATCGTVAVIQAFSQKPTYFDASTPILVLMANTAANAIHSLQLHCTLERTSHDLSQTYDATIDGWSRALELRDFATERHTERVVSMTMELGKKIGLDDSDLVRVKRGAQLHDIGKMGIPDSILLKPGPLDEAEWRVMRKHPVYAYELLRPIPRFAEIVDIPYCHHEKWDGSGYPRRLKGSEIPLPARIFSVVDVWDALSSNRPYRSAWPQHQVLDYIQTQSSKYFEPDITRAFLDIVKGRTFNRSQTLPLFRRPMADVYGQAN